MSASISDVTHAANLLQDKLTLSENDGSTIVKTNITLPNNQKKLAFVLGNVVTKEECEGYIKKTENMGYEMALINAGGGRQELHADIRNNSRCIWDTFEESEKLWQRIKCFIPEDFKPGYIPVGLNERLRFLRYDPGEFFKPHFDGCYVRENGEKSFITVQLYLNEGFEGGSTTFVDFYGQDESPIIPKTGNVLVFQHDILHEGSKLVKGRKYAMRTDVMFKRSDDKSEKYICMDNRKLDQES